MTLYEVFKNRKDGSNAVNHEMLPARKLDY